MVSAILPFIEDRIAWASWNLLELARDANPNIGQKYFG